MPARLYDHYAAGARSLGAALRETFDRLHRLADVRDVAWPEDTEFDARESVLGATTPEEVLCPVRVDFDIANYGYGASVELRRGDGSSETPAFAVRLVDGRWRLGLESLAVRYTALRSLRVLPDRLTADANLAELEGVVLTRPFAGLGPPLSSPMLTDVVIAVALAHDEALCMRWRGAWRCTEATRIRDDRVQYEPDVVVIDDGAATGRALVGIRRETSSSAGETQSSDAVVVVVAIDPARASVFAHFPVMIRRIGVDVRDHDDYTTTEHVVFHEWNSHVPRCLDIEIEDTMVSRSRNGGPRTIIQRRPPRAPDRWDGHDPSGDDVLFDWSGSWSLQLDGSFARATHCGAVATAE